MQTLWLNLRELWDVLVAALILGAGVPAVFAFAVRCWARAETVHPDGRVERNYLALSGAVLCVVLLVAVVVSGILFTAKAFIAHQFGIHLFGQS
ncbi:hypothetical protein ACFO5K_17575 [Nocardia halotolerans]|uniref:Uncharacterized protein n=1 Tax=Nocardia halotolerans TaxID=1755878 RepID=A0ABV8VIP9_9NOCA